MRGSSTSLLGGRGDGGVNGVEAGMGVKRGRGGEVQRGHGVHLGGFAGNEMLGAHA